MTIERLYLIGPHIFNARTYDMLDHFTEILEKKSIEFESIDDLVFYMGHLALTHLCIKDLQEEYSELKKNELKIDIK